MSLVVTVRADTHEELAEKLGRLADLFKNEKAELVSEMMAPEISEAKEKPKKKTAKKAPKEEAVVAPAIDAFNKLTHEAVTERLRIVSKARGVPFIQELLAEFDCARVSQLKPDQYEDVLSACEMALSV